MKILVVDDHKMFCDGLRLILDRLEFEPELFEAPSSAAALEILQSQADIGLVMLDIKLPDRGGIDLLKDLSRLYPTLPVIMLTASSSRHLIKQCFDAGASGYVPKSSGAEIMINAIRLVLAGGVYVPPSVLNLEEDANSLLNGKPSHALLSKLTPRQGEVLKLLQAGNSNKQIADELGLSESTVKAHISAILSTLNLRSRVEAALLAQRLDSGTD